MLLALYRLSMLATWFILQDAIDKTCGCKMRSLQTRHCIYGGLLTMWYCSFVTLPTEEMLVL